MARRREVTEQPRAPREAVFHPEFREDLRYWVATDRKVAVRVLDLVEAVLPDVLSSARTWVHDINPPRRAESERHSIVGRN